MQLENFNVNMLGLVEIKNPGCKDRQDESVIFCILDIGLGQEGGSQMKDVFGIERQSPARCYLPHIPGRWFTALSCLWLLGLMKCHYQMRSVVSDR